MKVIQGKYNKANVYASVVDDQTVSQVEELLNQEFIQKSHIAIMPDCHTGTGCVIGTTMTIVDKVVPNLVGVDIGCGMLTIKLGDIDIDYEKLDSYIHQSIPCGQDVYEEEVESITDITQLKSYPYLGNKKRIHSSIGTLGGGNHFIEIDIDDEKNKYLVIHTGSRNLGTQVADYYQDVAVKYHTFKFYEEQREQIKLLKEAGRQKEIEQYMLDKRKEFDETFNKSLAYLEGQNFEDYLFDMDICQKFASENRFTIAKKILSSLGLDIEDYEYFETVHNYINMKDKILRKGAISAYDDEIVLIPINMKDGSIIAKGKSNKEYNFSAPHGAGRLYSRSKAKKEIKLEDYVKAMEGIYSTTVSYKTLDESPFAYKNINDILENIKDTVDVIKIIRPLYNFKAED